MTVELWTHLEGISNGGKGILVMTLSVPSPGVTPVDGTPHRPHAECYPVLLDGVMIGWVDKELAPSVAASLRHFKVNLSLCELFLP